MLNLHKRIGGVDADREYLEKRIAIRDQLLAQGNFDCFHTYFTYFFLTRMSPILTISYINFIYLYVNLYLISHLLVSLLSICHIVPFSEIAELKTRVRELATCRLEFPDLKMMHEFYLLIAPTTGYYRGGVFKFHVTVPPEYNNSVCFSYA